MNRETTAGERSLRLMRAAFFAVVVLFVVFDLIVDPISVDPDGVAYLDLGDAILSGRPWAIVGYFSPLYATWIALVVRIVQPSIAHEFVVVRAASGVIVLVAAFAFEMLITEAVALVRRGAPAVSIREPWWRAYGYVLFIWAAVQLVQTSRTTPDIAVMAVVFAATAMVLKLSATSASGAMGAAPSPSIAGAARLGALLGVGYLAKAVVFVNSFIILGVFSWLCRRAPRAVLAAWVTFLLVVAPWVTAISVKTGHATISDVGHLALVWFESPAPVLHWQGDEPGLGTPVHPTRRLMRNPDVFEFATPYPVSYPPWYDASYWNAGVKWNPDARVIARHMLGSAWGTAPRLWMGAVALIVLLGLARSAGPVLAAIGPAGALGIPAVASYVMYAPMATFPRYVAPWAVFLYLFLAVAWATWKEGRLVRSTEMVMGVLAIALSVQVARGAAKRVSASVDVATRTIRHHDDDDVRAAIALRDAGLRPGDAAAGIGTGGAFTSWARLARLRTVAESPVTAAGSFWTSDSVTRARVLGIFREQGARVVVADSLPSQPDRGWRRVPGGRYAFCLFESAAADERCPVGER